MSSLTAVRDAITGQLRTAWLADGTTAALPLLYDDVDGDKPGHDANGKPIPYGRVTVRHLASATETIGSPGKEEYLGQVVVQVFAPKGKGRSLADLMAQVALAAFQRQRIPGVDGWYFSAVALEVEAAGPWSQTNVVAQFRYSESVG